MTDLNAVSAPAPDSKDRLVRLEVDIEYLRRCPPFKIAQYLGLVRGEMPLPPGGTRGLRAANALFRGLERPCNHEAQAETIFAYVTCPPHSYRFNSWDRVFEKDAAPANSVFVVYTSMLDNDNGNVLGWEWVLASSDDDRLPEGYKLRYGGKIW